MILLQLLFPLFHLALFIKALFGTGTSFLKSPLPNFGMLSKKANKSSSGSSSRKLVLLSLAVIILAGVLVYKFFSLSSSSEASSSQDSVVGNNMNVVASSSSSSVLKMSSVDVMAGDLPQGNDAADQDHSQVKEKFITVQVR